MSMEQDCCLIPSKPSKTKKPKKRHVHLIGACVSIVGYDVVSEAPPQECGPCTDKTCADDPAARGSANACRC